VVEVEIVPVEVIRTREDEDREQLRPPRPERNDDGNAESQCDEDAAQAQIHPEGMRGDMRQPGAGEVRHGQAAVAVDRRLHRRVGGFPRAPQIEGARDHEEHVRAPLVGGEHGDARQAMRDPHRDRDGSSPSERAPGTDPEEERGGARGRDGHEREG
jgi:hypothetical protein